MYAGNDLQAVQLLSGGSYVAVSSNAGSWTRQNSSNSAGRSNKGSRGSSASKGASAAPHNILPSVGHQVAYIDATTGHPMTHAASQAFAQPAAAQRAAGQQALCAQPPSSTLQVQVHAFQQNGQQPPQAQQVLQLHSAPAGAQVYKVLNGTRVVKAGQPYPNTTIVPTAMAMSIANPQSQPQQQLGIITVRPQSVSPPLQQAQIQPQSQQQPQQQLNQQMQALQVQLPGAGAMQLEAATSGGAAQQQMHQQKQQKQQQQQQQGQQAKVTLLQQAVAATQPPAPHVLVAQPQQQLAVQQQPQKQLQGKQQRQVSAPAALQAVTLRPAGPLGASPAVTTRGTGNGPVTIQALYAPPSSVTAVVRPAVRIPKLGTVATYNPVTGVRSATTTSGPGGATMPLLPANLPTSLVQQVQKANALQLQQQQPAASASAAAAAAGSLTAVLAVQPQAQGQVMRPVGPMNTVVTTLAAPMATANGAPQQPQQQRQATLVIAGGAGGGAGMATAVPPPPTRMGITILGSALQQLQQHQHVAAVHTKQQQQIHVASAAGGPQLQQLSLSEQQLLQPQQQQLQPQQQQQVVNITLADGTTTTTVMDQATLARMLSESSRGQAAKLQQQQLQQQLQPGQSAVDAGPIQLQLQALPMQQQQMLLQTAPQLAGPGLLTVLNTGGASGGKGLGGGGSSSGLEHLSGLQTVHLAAAAPAAMNGPSQVLIRSTSQIGGGAVMGPVGTGAGSTVARGGAQPQANAAGLSQVGSFRTVQVLGPSTAGLQQTTFLPAGLQSQQQQLLQQQQQQPSNQQPSRQSHVHLLQLQQQTPLGRRPSSGREIPSGEEMGTATATLKDPSSMAHAQQLQTLGAQHHLQHHQLPQPQGVLHSQSQPQPQHLHSMVEGLSVVDLDGSPNDRLQRPHQHQHILGAMQPQRLRKSGGAAFNLAAVQAGATLYGGGVSLGLLQGVGGGGGGGGGSSLHSGRLEPTGGLILPREDMAMAAVTGLAPGGGGGGGDAASVLAFGAVAGSAGGSGGRNGSSREDLKVILVSIGQELARHGISVETAVMSGWLGLLTAMDVAVLADAYTEEERRLMMQHKAQPPSAAQQQQQQPETAAVAATRVAADSAPLLGQLPQGMAASDEFGLGGSGGGCGGGSDRDSQSGSNRDRGSVNLLNLTTASSSCARTGGAMSVAPSEDGASTGSGGVSGGADASAPYASVGGGAAGMYDLRKFNCFQYGFLGPGMLATHGAEDLSPDREKLTPGTGSEVDRDADNMAAMADVFGEKLWSPFGMSIMADEIGLSAQPRLHSLQHQPFPASYASELLLGGSRSDGSGGANGGAARNLIDSASEYEASRSIQQSQQPQRHHHSQRQHQPPLHPRTAGGGGGSSGAGGGGADLLHGAKSALPVNGPGGDASGAGKACSAAAGGGGGMFSGGGMGGPPSSSAGNMDKEVESRFANLDLGCGFY